MKLAIRKIATVHPVKIIMDEHGNDFCELGIHQAKHAEELIRRANSHDDLLAALTTIEGGMTSEFPGAPDVMESSPEQFRSDMWAWSQAVARDAIAKATERS